VNRIFIDIATLVSGKLFTEKKLPEFHPQANADEMSKERKRGSGPC